MNGNPIAPSLFILPAKLYPRIQFIVADDKKFFVGVILRGDGFNAILERRILSPNTKHDCQIRHKRLFAFVFSIEIADINPDQNRLNEHKGCGRNKKDEPGYVYAFKDSNSINGS